jgi:hypothetical protein
MSDRRKALFLSCLLLAAQQHAASAAQVTYTTPSDIASALPYDLSISPSITGADELISINNGTITGSEYSNYSISALFSDNPSQVLYTKQLGCCADTASDTLDRTYDASFGPDTLIGLEFTDPDGASVAIPEGTVFTFDAQPMPEPSTAAILGTALAAVPLLRRRRAHAGAATS